MHSIEHCISTLVIAHKYVYFCMETIHKGSYCLRNNHHGFHSNIYSVLLNFLPHLFIPRGEGFPALQRIHLFVLSYFMLMLRATLCAMVGLLNHNQLILVHVCVTVLEVAVGGSTKDAMWWWCGGGLSPEIVRDAKLWLEQRREG